MPAFLIFNDLCCEQVGTEFVAAVKLMDDFISVVLDDRIKGKKLLVTSTNFPQMQVSPGYSVGRLLKEIKLDDNDRQLRLKTLVNRRIAYTDAIPNDLFEGEHVEYRVDSRNAQGAFVAFSLDGLCVSLLTRSQWDCSSLDLEKSWIEGETVETRILDVPHASRAAHLVAHSQWLQRNLPLPPANGLALWNDRGSLFPSLDFCSSVEHQINKLAGSEQRFKAIFRGLQDLQAYCDYWTTPNFDIHQLCHASGESTSTLAMYSEDRTFMCPDGQFRVFNWHLKRAGSRIHFFDFPETKTILIGYAGAHLPISSQ